MVGMRPRDAVVGGYGGEEPIVAVCYGLAGAVLTRLAVEGGSTVREGGCDS